LIVLAPIYAVARGNLGAGIFAVQFFSVAAVLSAYGVGRRLAGFWGGAIAALVLLHASEFAIWSRYIMTDVPVAAVGRVLWRMYLQRPWEKRRWVYFLVAGSLVALAGGMRGLAYVMVIPFIMDAITRPIDVRNVIGVCI